MYLPNKSLFFITYEAVCKAAPGYAQSAKIMSLVMYSAKAQLTHCMTANQFQFRGHFRCQATDWEGGGN